MTKKLSLLLFVIFALQQIANSQIAPNNYLINFTDKKNSEYSIDKPEKFLSKRALERRKKYGIAITEQDLPVNKQYIKKLKALGLKIENVSKWLNSAVVSTKDSSLIDKAKELPFVSSIGLSDKYYNKEKKSSKNNIYQKPNEKTLIKHLAVSVDDFKNNKDYEKYNKIYGKSLNQIQIHNGHLMHDAAYRGEGMHVAILDGGFYKVDSLPAFDSIRANNQILGVRDFVDKDGMVYDASSHGMMVLSTMAGNIPGKLLGTAPKASYWLLRTEVGRYEYIIEEYNWLAAAEFADSAGVDVINSSLGYNGFDDKLQSHKVIDLDGNTALGTRAADIAASKGMLIVLSAGNSGASKWKYITVPGDADSVITVGAITKTGKHASFSSYGLGDSRLVKPNVCAIGNPSTVSSRKGNVSTAHGTSFASPIMAGLVTCLWQAHPELNNMQIIDILQRSSSQYNQPDTALGYGIPDIYAAHLYAKSITKNNDKKEVVSSNHTKINFEVSPNPFNKSLSVIIENNDFTGSYNAGVELRRDKFNIVYGKLYVSIKKKQKRIKIRNLKKIKPGKYILQIKIGNTVISKEVIKK